MSATFSPRSRPLPGAEVFEPLLAGGAFRMERIVSAGQATPAGGMVRPAGGRVRRPAERVGDSAVRGGRRDGAGRDARPVARRLAGDPGGPAASGRADRGGGRDGLARRPLSGRRGRAAGGIIGPSDEASGGRSLRGRESSVKGSRGRTCLPLDSCPLTFPGTAAPPLALQEATIVPQGTGSVMSDHVEIGGVTLYLSNPDVTPGDWIGQSEVLRQILACWIVVDEKDLPLAPRLVGSPGIGKTTLGIARRQGAEAGALYLSMHQRHPAGGPAGDARARRERPDQVPRQPARDRDDPRRHLPAGRGQPHEREELGQPRPAARPPPLRREHRRRHHDPRPPRLPLRGDDERRRKHLRDPRLHPQPPSADPEARPPEPRRRTEHPEVSPPVRRARDAQPDGRVPAAGARPEARLLDPRRDQRLKVRDEADRRGPEPSRRQGRRLAGIA